VRRIHRDVIRQARAQRRRLERATGARVEPLVVYSQAWVDTPLRRRDGVRIVPARMLVRFFEQQQPRLSAEEAHAVRGRLVEALGKAGPPRRVSLVRGR
jgi:hypothetical protein